MTISSEGLRSAVWSESSGIAPSRPYHSKGEETFEEIPATKTRKKVDGADAKSAVAEFAS
jgi:hypothetical protein